MESITNAQEIYLNLIEEAGEWNSFNGPRIVADLRANLDLWRSAFFTRLPAITQGTKVAELRHHINLIVLRDLPAGQVNLDTLFILPEPTQQAALSQLTLAWLADEVAWIPLPQAARAMGATKAQFPEYSADEERFLLRIWWD